MGMKRMYNEARLVHADLSEYNLLWFENRVWVIDVAQAVEPSHPKALEFLYRDCCNVVKFFGGKLALRNNVLNSRKLFQIIAKNIDLSEIEISEKFYEEDRNNVSSVEIANFVTKLEELQRRSKDNADMKKG